MQAVTHGLCQRLLPTGKAGELELGVAGIGPNSKGKFGGVAALRTTSGNEVVKIAKALSLAVPASAATLKFDIEKVGDGQRHAVRMVDGGAERPGPLR